ncbi:MAG TPA: hypothetical protein VKA38_09670 [Draconibacterium sp.]|nr:hypothetical protein [Draconibacterium sp.]
MNDAKVDTLKNEITNNIINKFNLQIDEVLSLCESEIEKIMVLHLCRYFQKFRKDGDWFNNFDNIEFIEDEIVLWEPDISISEKLKRERRVKRYNYREEGYHFLKNIGFKVAYSFTEPISLDSTSDSPLIDDLVKREFEVRPQYPVSIDGIDYRLDIAIILNRKSLDGKLLESKKVALECDGYDYHSSPQQKMNDDIRTRKLKKTGWKEVLRYSGRELNRLSSVDEIDALFEEIVDVLFV